MTETVGFDCGMHGNWIETLATLVSLCNMSHMVHATVNEASGPGLSGMVITRVVGGRCLIFRWRMATTFTRGMQPLKLMAQRIHYTSVWDVEGAYSERILPHTFFPLH